MPSAIRLLDFRPVRIRPFEPRSLRMDLPRTRSVRVAFQAWRARLRSLDLPSIMRPLVRPLRAVHPRPMAAGVVAILGGTFAVLAVARMPAPAVPDQPPTVATPTRGPRATRRRAPALRRMRRLLSETIRSPALGHPGYPHHPLRHPSRACGGSTPARSPRIGRSCRAGTAGLDSSTTVAADSTARGVR